MFTITVVGSIIEIILFTSPSLIVAKLIDLFINGSPTDIIMDWIVYLLLLVISQAIVFYIVATVNEINGALRLISAGYVTG